MNNGFVNGAASLTAKTNFLDALQSSSHSTPRDILTARRMPVNEVVDTSVDIIAPRFVKVSPKACAQF